MKQNKGGLLDQIKGSLEDYRECLVNLREHKYNKHYKDKLKKAEKKLNKFKLLILKKKDLVRNETFMEIKENIHSIVISKDLRKKEKFLEATEDLLENFNGDKYEELELKEIFYDRGEQYDFYKDIKKLIQIAKVKIFIVDSYIDQDLFEVYLDKINQNIELEILTNSNTPKGNIKKIASMYRKKHKGKFEIREINLCHDRAIFIDDEGWVIGQSIKDLARNKPSYMIKLILLS